MKLYLFTVVRNHVPDGDFPGGDFDAKATGWILTWAQPMKDAALYGPIILKGPGIIIWPLYLLLMLIWVATSVIWAPILILVFLIRELWNYNRPTS